MQAESDVTDMPWQNEEISVAEKMDTSYDFGNMNCVHDAAVFIF